MGSVDPEMSHSPLLGRLPKELRGGVKMMAVLEARAAMHLVVSTRQT